MYVDDAVVFGVAIVVLTCVFMGYWGYYAYQHIRDDIKNHPGE